jgi:hypothetical protein
VDVTRPGRYITHGQSELRTGNFAMIDECALPASTSALNGAT